MGTAILALCDRGAQCFDRVEDWDLDLLAATYYLTHPSERNTVRDAMQKWGVEFEALSPWTREREPTTCPMVFTRFDADLGLMRNRLDLLEYNPVFLPKSTTTISVTYSHLLDNSRSFDSRSGRYGHGNPYVNHFQYILKTARRWKHFGPIHLTMTWPAESRFICSYKLEKPQKKGEWQRGTATLDGSKVDKNLLVGLEFPYGTPEGGQKLWRRDGQTSATPEILFE